LVPQHLFPFPFLRTEPHCNSMSSSCVTLSALSVSKLYGAVNMTEFIKQKLKILILILKFGSQETILSLLTAVLLILTNTDQIISMFQEVPWCFFFFYLLLFYRAKVLSEKYLCPTMMLLHYLISAVWLCVEIITRNAVD
jgi:hypothetical protein